MSFTQKSCCGVNGPQDWVMYNSSFRQQYSDASYPWPRQCCQQDAMGGVVQLQGCQIGVNPYLSTTVNITQNLLPYICSTFKLSLTYNDIVYKTFSIFCELDQFWQISTCWPSEPRTFSSHSLSMASANVHTLENVYILFLCI